MPILNNIEEEYDMNEKYNFSIKQKDKKKIAVNFNFYTKIVNI